ncbi:hypothetical protein B0A50_05984 [Salinomyces thailandicus]|uniref:Cullin family profile domain-containing protein n=1 Tax=Salinomyces thailandicus TaxID=706561 RepID=A0A4U0TQ79_9PEZI|nr:hypothetical protein B0A50_05984 [Salinomyces thailandica]
MAAAVSTAYDIFASVFPPKQFTKPTPETTPQIGSFSSPGESFGGFNSPHGSGTAQDAVHLERAWSAATRYLSCSNPPDDRQDARPSREVQDAFFLLCGNAAALEKLATWCANDLDAHVRDSVLPKLNFWQHPIPLSTATEAIAETVRVLSTTQDTFLTRPFALSRLGSGALEVFYHQVRQSFLASALHSIPQQRMQKTLACAFHQCMVQSMEHNDPDICKDRGLCSCPVNLGPDLDNLYQVGLGGDLAERAFAHAMHKFLQRSAIDRTCFRLEWGTEQASVVQKLRFWVASVLVPFIENTLKKLSANPSLKLSDSDKYQFQQIAVGSLGRSRTANLFDYVKKWPDTKGALLDIKDCMASSTNEKSYICNSFVQQVSTRLLHAGASTTEILSIYTAVIYSFRLLDSRGVMLEKVSGPIRAYLRTRDDTVSIIAASFLADVDAEGNVLATDPTKVCADITIEVSRSSLEDTRDHRVTDWNDMLWTPDPIDAGPDYKASRSEDVMAYILGLFDPEDFIKEVTTVLAQHLLQATDPEYVKETRLTELFKSRLDATKLQAAEVMLKDVRDSVSLNRRINPSARFETASAELPKPKEIMAAIPEDGITAHGLYALFEYRMKPAQFTAAVNLVASKRGELYFPKRTRLPQEAVRDEPTKEGALSYKVQVLSGFFWPQMRSNDFALPQQFAEMDEAFGERFSRLGNQRKLHFRKALARVTVELELEDRRVRETDVPAWRASVINTFADHEAGTILTAEQLMTTLGMEEELVADALGFWSGKRVLFQPTPGTYAVLESLDMDTGPPQPDVQPQADAVSAMMSQDAMLRESAPMFETFIKGMLRDGGPKEIGGFMGITNMLKMVLPTFTYGDDEVKLLLNEMVTRGEVVRNGETWAVAG